MARGSCFIGPTTRVGLHRYIGTSANNPNALVDWNQNGVSVQTLRSEMPVSGTGMRSMWIDAGTGGQFGVQEGALAVPSETRPALSSGIISAWIFPSSFAVSDQEVGLVNLYDDSNEVVRLTYNSELGHRYGLRVRTEDETSTVMLREVDDTENIVETPDLRDGEWHLIALGWEIIGSRIIVRAWVDPEPEDAPLLEWDSDDHADTYVDGQIERWGAFSRAGGGGRSFFYAPVIVHPLADEAKALTGRVCYAGALPSGAGGIDVAGSWSSTAGSGAADIAGVLSDDDIATTYAESDDSGATLTLSPSAPSEIPEQIDACEVWLVVSGPGEIKVRAGIGDADGDEITYSITSRRQEVYHPIPGVTPANVDDVVVEVEVESTTAEIRVYSFRLVVTGGESVANGPVVFGDPFFGSPLFGTALIFDPKDTMK